MDDISYPMFCHLAFPVNEFGMCPPFSKMSLSLPHIITYVEFGSRISYLRFRAELPKRLISEIISCITYRFPASHAPYIRTRNLLSRVLSGVSERVPGVSYLLYLILRVVSHSLHPKHRVKYRVCNNILPELKHVMSAYVYVTSCMSQSVSRVDGLL